MHKLIEYMKRYILLLPVILSVALCMYFINLLERIDVDSHKPIVVEQTLTNNTVKSQKEYRLGDISRINCKHSKDALLIMPMPNSEHVALTNELQIGVGFLLLFTAITNWIMVAYVKHIRYKYRRRDEE